jgi:subtilase family serine protease
MFKFSKKTVVLCAVCCLVFVQAASGLFSSPGAAHAAIARRSQAGSDLAASPRQAFPGPTTAWRARATPGLPLPCQEPGASTPCYSPAQIQTAYAAAPLLKAGDNGAGQTVVIVDDSQDPSLGPDLHVFDQAFGLPDPQLSISSVGCSLEPSWSCQPGAPGVANPGISLEITIDVEWAHALAPGATIHLLEVNDDSATTAEQILEYYQAAAGYAITNRLGQVVSLSVGFAEACSTAAFIAFEHAIFLQAQKSNITVVAAAGDEGTAQFTCDATSFFPTPAVATPASDPLVLAVGGTHLKASANGTYQGESAWTQVSVANNNGAGGGGFSQLYPKPGYQLGVTGAMRGIPDVSINGDNNSGYIVECSYCNGGVRVFFSLGGTSISAPAWAGLVALADQLAHHPLGFINPALYQIARGPLYQAAFHDVTTGNNSYSFINAAGQPVTVPGYNATAGWDAATGLGTPDAQVLLPLLVATAG